MEVKGGAVDVRQLSRASRRRLRPPAGAREKAEHSMSSTILNITVDCADPLLAARFWAELTGWEITSPWRGDYAVGTAADGRPRLYFVPVSEAKIVKNRVHLDVVPADRSQEAEIARLTALGATVISDRRPEVGWVILADPAGNEFCVEPGAAPPGPG
jgi:predicted enzyme related to lactoylglutathione lyase